MDDRSLTAKEACVFLQVSDSTLRRYVKIGKLPAGRLAGIRSLRFRRSDLLALLEQVQAGNERDED